MQTFTKGSFVNDKQYYLIPSSRVHEVFGKLERWSIIDLYRTAKVLPSVAKNVLENLHVGLVARKVDVTPKNRWGVSYPIYEFLDETKRAQAYHERLHSHCWTPGITEARFTNDFCECPSGFDVPHETDSLRSEFLNHDAVIRSEEEWLLRYREQFDRTVQRGMYEDSDKAEQVFEWYKTIHAILMELWSHEVASAKYAGVLLPGGFTPRLAEAAGGLLLAGPHHVEHVKKALDRWYKSPLVLRDFESVPFVSPG